MNTHPESPHIHFHIHWEDSQKLDWECFETQSDAMGRAFELARPEERFTIEEVSTNCPLRCSFTATPK
jgi:hypothetical protein